MNRFDKLATILSFPLVFINLVGGIVSGIWLALLGEWSVIGYGVGLLVASNFLLGPAITPGKLIATLVAKIGDAGSSSRHSIFNVFDTIYTITLFSAWTVFILFFFLAHSDSDSFIPILIWSYGIAMYPLQDLAQKEIGRGDAFIIYTVLFVQISYAFTIALLILGVTVIDTLVFFGIFMLTGLIVRLKIGANKAS